MVALLRAVFFLIDVSTILSFVMTSSMLHWLWPTTSVFLDDLEYGVFDFTPRSAVDHLLLDEFRSATTPWGHDTVYMGYQDKRHNSLGTASHCKRIGVDVGSNNVVSYYGDGKTRRVIKKFHGSLPASCTGFTVEQGEPHNSRRIVTHANDARLAVGQSFLRCTDAALWATQRYDASKPTQMNSTEFRFKAAYVIVQQHYAGAHFGVECQLSYCVASKISADSDFWSVEPADPNDTRAYVNLLFTTKSRFLRFMDASGQLLVAAVLLYELWRGWVGGMSIHIPFSPPTSMVGQLRNHLGRLGVVQSDNTEYLNAGASRLRFSKSWLGSSLYMIGNCAHAIGTTVESQMIVEVYYWQYTKSGNLRELLYAGVYSMRHTWVGIATCAVIRWMIGTLLRNFRPRLRRDKVQDFTMMNAVNRDVETQSVCYQLHSVLLHFRSLQLYVSSKTFFISFFIAAIITVRGRGTLILTQHQEMPDVGLGAKKSSFWGSEIAHSLLLHHVLAHLISYLFSIALRALCSCAWPHHERNSVIRVLDELTWWPSFDVVDFLAMNRHYVDEQRLYVIVRLSELYQLLSSTKLFGWITLRISVLDNSVLSAETEGGHGCAANSGGVMLVLPPANCVLEIAKETTLRMVHLRQVAVAEARHLVRAMEFQRTNSVREHTSSDVRSARFREDTERDLPRVNPRGVLVVR